LMRMEQASRIIEGIHYDTGRVVRIGTENGLIRSITDVEGISQHDPEGRAALPMVAPGLVDLQVNGYKGVDFNTWDLSGKSIKEVLPVLAARGITTFYPTLVTGSPDRISRSLNSIAAAMDEQEHLSKLLGGIHLEGPFISPEDGPRGAHAKEYCRLPDPDLVKRWQEEAGGKIRIITLAPELSGSIELISVCRELGMLVAIGHTAASADDIKRAVDLGASLSTHLGNGSHALLPRHPNYIWEQLAEDRLFASMIADGFHLNDSVLKVFSRSKGKKGILVSDSMCLAGLDPGDYDSPATGKVRLTEDGKLHIAGNPGILAGSASCLLDGVVHMARLTGFAAAWEMGSILPARLMHDERSHGLKVGSPADLVLLEEGGRGKEKNREKFRAKVIKVYKNGEPIFQKQ